jgi:hypothetical protein
MHGSLPTCFNNALPAPCKVKVAGEKVMHVERERESGLSQVVSMLLFS